MAKGSKKTRGKRRQDVRRTAAPAAVAPARAAAKPAETKARTAVPEASPAPPEAAVAWWRRDITAFAVLALFTLVSYIPAILWGDFVWDDGVFVESRYVRDVSGLWHIWFNPAGGGLREEHYWPMIYSSFWLEHKLWGFEPMGYHAVNVLLHLANTWLLLRILSKLAVPGAWLIAAVFALHPVHVESVAWVIERKDVLSGLFYLGAVLLWLRGEEHADGNWRYWLALVCAAAGMLSKSVVVTLPAALLLIGWWRHGTVTAQDLKRAAPFFLITLGIAAADTLYVSTLPVDPEFAEYPEYSMLQRILIAAQALWFYFGKVLWPTSLAVIYPFWPTDLGHPWGYVAVLAGALLIAGLFLLRSRIGRGPLAGALFFAITLSPVLGFVDYGYYLHFSFVADRYQYLASIGPIAVLVGGAVAYSGTLASMGLRASNLRNMAPLGAALGWGFAGAVLLACGVLTWHQSAIYDDKISFYSHIIALNPEARGAHLGLANAHRKAGDLEQAIPLARAAVERYPGANAYRALARSLAEAERLEEALTQARMGVERHPSQHIYTTLVDILVQLERFDEALAVGRIAVDRYPKEIAVHNGLGVALRKAGQLDEAMAQYRKALSVDPDHQNTLKNVIDILQAQERYEELISVAERLLRLYPGDPELSDVRGVLSQTLAEVGRPEDALKSARDAVRRTPNDPNAHLSLGSMLYGMGRIEEALESARAAAALDAESAEAHGKMGLALFDLGRMDEAEVAFVASLAIDPLHASSLSGLSGVRMAQARYADMRDLLESLLEVQPDDASAYANMAIALHYLGRSREALDSIDRALAIDPTLATALANRPLIAQGAAQGAAQGVQGDETTSEEQP